mmetsp:Transcript_122387/g.357257  ORF Transcript_122387/g.357257 Transcript_122387/m.357257 type:complete len:239 (-) Transcript_122387:301-1017(-)
MLKVILLVGPVALGPLDDGLREAPHGGVGAVELLLVHDGLRHTLGHDALVAVGAELRQDVGELLRRDRLQPLHGRDARVRVHAEIHWPLHTIKVLQREASSPLIHHGVGDADVHERAVDLHTLQRLRDLRERPVDNLEAAVLAGQRPADFHGVGVDVEGEEPRVVGQAREDLPRVAAAAKGAVDIGATVETVGLLLLRPEEELHGRVQQHRRMAHQPTVVHGLLMAVLELLHLLLELR